MMFNWIEELFCPSKEDLALLVAIDSLYKEHMMSPRGGISKPEYAEKHKQELENAFPEIREEIRKHGFCKIKG